MSVIICKAVTEGDGNQVAVPTRLMRELDEAMAWIREETLHIYFDQMDDPIPAAVGWKRLDIQAEIERRRYKNSRWEITPILEEPRHSLPLDEFAAPPFEWNGWITWRGTTPTEIISVDFMWGIHETDELGNKVTHDWVGFVTWVLIWTSEE